MAQMQIEFDNQKQMERIRSMVNPPEILYAVFDEKGRGTGFVGITDRRERAWRRKTADEAESVFAEIGMTGPFWSLKG